jgi:amino acid transporter
MRTFHGRAGGDRVAQAPRPFPAEPPVQLPESRRYRLKRKVLGPPLDSDQLEHERLGKPTALAVFASDNLSSSAYATEEILRVLIPLVGVAAFSLVVPITVAMLVVLFFLILSYRETIKEYPTAGGAYVVTRDNFGIIPAQVAGVSLLTDYVLTVSVSVAAGSAALASAFDVFSPYVVPISLAFIALIAFGNLRGVRESGRVFAVPTYFFMVMMGVLLLIGFFELVNGNLPHASLGAKGLEEFGSPGDGLFLGASLYGILHAFASGGAAVTGVEAISNGVPAFRKPEWRNARTTLVIMGSALGVMFLGISVLASDMKVAPFADGTPTVISEVGRLVFGQVGGGGDVLFYLLQAATMLILVLAANTSFADFPRLASFQATDSFMPKQLTKRGHRLVFSNGIIALSVAAAFLVIVTQAQVQRLIPLYAIGVFTSFTLSQAGMARHHIRLKEPGWRRGLFVNGFGAFLSFVVLLVVAITKFEEGAWAILVIVPILVVLVIRLNRQYREEAGRLERDAEIACTAPILRRHVVLVFVARLDASTARAIQYGRTLMPDEVRAVHIAWDRAAAEELADGWRRLGLSRVPLELVDCPDRRVARAALEVVAREVADAKTEVTVLLPHRLYRHFWHRFLHDNTGDEIATAVSKLEHANVTMVPFQMEERAPAPSP